MEPTDQADMTCYTPSECVLTSDLMDRLRVVEGKVDGLHAETRGMVKAFEAANGAFVMLEWLSKLAKPILWVVAAAAALLAMVDGSSRRG